jgi:CubicO group peptidase (beta-lactamase class C family)
MERGKIGLLVALLGATACAPGATKRTTAPLDDVLRAAVDQRRVPAVVAMVATAESVAYQGAFGVAKDGIFSIASMTKPVTSVAVMQLVEAGKVKLDEPAATYLPELGAVQVLERGTLRAPKGQVTVRMLLSHTSGFAYEFLNRDLHEYVAKGRTPSVMAGGDAFLEAPLLFDPGARWEYGINTDWLGKLVEKVSGQTLEAYFKEHVFAPLGMADTCFDVPPDKRPRLVAQFQRQDDGKLAEQPSPPRKPVEFFSGGGGLFSTAEDYLTFTRAIMGGGQLGRARILTAESVALMGQNQLGELELRLPQSVVPQLAKPGAVMPGSLDKFGLGFALNTRPIAKGRGANTLSWAGIYNTFFWIDRDKKVCAVLMTQVLPFLDDGPRALLEDFDRAVYAWRDADAR